MWVPRSGCHYTYIMCNLGSMYIHGWILAAGIHTWSGIWNMGQHIHGPSDEAWRLLYIRKKIVIWNPYAGANNRTCGCQKSTVNLGAFCWHPDLRSGSRSPVKIGIRAPRFPSNEPIYVHIYIYKYVCMYVRMHVCECVSVRVCGT